MNRFITAEGKIKEKVCVAQLGSISSGAYYRAKTLKMIAITNYSATDWSLVFYAASRREYVPVVSTPA